VNDAVMLQRVAVIGDGATRARDVLGTLASAGYYGRGFLRAARIAETNAQWNAVIFLDAGVSHDEADAEILRRISKTRPLIIATARIDMDVVRHAAGLGAHDVVLRGDGARLVESLRRAMSERASVPVDSVTQRVREELMGRLFDLTPNYVSIRDEDGRYVMVSQAYADLYGTTVDDMTGKPVSAFMHGTAASELELAEDLEVLRSRRSRSN
jgi:PAS domain-containing protein